MQTPEPWEGRLERIFTEIVRLLGEPGLSPGASASLKVAYTALWAALDGMGIQYTMDYTWE